jgi:hypothetical protein
VSSCHGSLNCLVCVLLFLQCCTESSHALECMQLNNCSFDCISNCKACLLSLDLVVPVDFGKCIGEASSCA